MAITQLLQFPRQIAPVPAARDTTPRADGRSDLIGLSREQITDMLGEAGIDAKQAKLCAKQLFHWIYHRGVTDFEAMTDIAKTMRPWLAGRFVIPGPIAADDVQQVVRGLLQSTRAGQGMRWDFGMGTSLEGTDYAAIARGFGCHGEVVTRAQDVAPAIERAIASGLPAVLDCRTRFLPHPAGPMFGAMNKFGFEALTRVA